MNNKKYNKKDEIARIKEAKKKGEIYISPMIFGDNAIFLQGILNGAKQIKKNINLNNEGGEDNAK
tara:strand:+ start:1587 stop:1781 length:195 start_codon:yes stop_codon:yes gene_type:complete